MENYGLRLVNKNKIGGLLNLVEVELIINNGQQHQNPFFGRNIYDLFPMTIRIGTCGCQKQYAELADFPDDSDECQHGNYYVLYDNV